MSGGNKDRDLDARNADRKSKKRREEGAWRREGMDGWMERKGQVKQTGEEEASEWS